MNDEITSCVNVAQNVLDLSCLNAPVTRAESLHASNPYCEQCISTVTSVFSKLCSFI